MKARLGIFTVSEYLAKGLVMLRKSYCPVTSCEYRDTHTMMTETINL